MPGTQILGHFRGFRAPHPESLSAKAGREAFYPESLSGCVRRLPDGLRRAATPSQATRSIPRCTGVMLAAAATISGTFGSSASVPPLPHCSLVWIGFLHGLALIFLAAQHPWLASGRSRATLPLLWVCCVHEYLCRYHIKPHTCGHAIDSGSPDLAS